MNALLLNLLTFLFGLWLGNLLAIGRDRRREFNDAVLPIREWLLAEIKEPSAYRPRPSAIEVDMFISCLRAWQRGRFREALERQREARTAAEAQDENGQVVYVVDAPIKAALRDCLRFTSRR